MKQRIKYGFILCICGIGGYLLGNMDSSNVIKKEQVIKEVIKYKTVDRIITKPDGTRIVEIIKEIDKSNEQSTKIKRAVSKHTLVSLSGGCHSIIRCTPTYGISLSKRILLGAYMGVYVRTDKEFGLVLSYSF